jgi:hypothetical protein
MCFSAGASFTTAAILGITQIAILKLPLKRKDLLLALIPGLFAIQQFFEGLVWLHYGHGFTSPLLGIAPYVFLFFAIFFWPVWVPLATWAAEEIPWRRTLLFVLFLVGALLVNFYATLIPLYPVDVTIVNKSIQYFTYEKNTVQYISALMYPAILILATLISSIRKIWIFGLIAAASFAFSQYFYRASFVSVWCFFAAVASILLYFILKYKNTPIEDKHK